MKKITFLKSILVLALMTIIGANANAQGTEDFTNSNATGSYTNNSFVGNNGITWTYVESRNGNGDANQSGINLPALMLRRSSDNSKITSSPIPNGIGNFSVKLYKGFTGSGNRQVELFVNGVSKGVSTAFDDNDEHVFTVNNINIAGNIIIEIVNTKSKQVILDDITWTAYTPTSPTITANPIALSFSAETGGSAITKDVTVTGSNLTADITATLSGANADRFSINSTSITQTGGTANGTINVTYTPTATAGNHIAQLTLSSTDATDVIVNLAGDSKEPTGTFTKIEKMDDLEVGKEYVIYGETSKGAGAMSNRLNSGALDIENVTVNNDKIENPDISAIWIIGEKNGGYKIQSKANNLYCLIKTNTSTSFTLEETVPHNYTITEYAQKFKIKTNAIAGDNRTIGLSTSDNPTDFRTYTGKYVSLYKKEDPSSPPTNNILNNKILSANAWVNYGKINFKATAGELVEIYTVTGQKVVSTTAIDGINSITVNTQGVLIVKVANRVSKVIL